MRVSVNDVDYTIDPRPEESTLELLRDRLDLTGAKSVCGTGACGACTVLLDGKPVSSCLLPAQTLEGHSVCSIEGVGPVLHPVQRAFMACDALQCGFCSPGFVLAGIAFYNQWQQSGRTGEPARAEVVGALAGHLCRCGAYAGIIEAVQGACAGRFDTAELSGVRRDALEKVTGQARYTVDKRYPGMLEGAILRSPHPHARILRIDTARAEALEGVRAVTVLLGKDRLVRYVGQEILAVAATDSAIARAALRQVEIVYERLPAVTDAASARRSGAPRVYGWMSGRAPNVGENPLVPARWRGNLRGPFTLMSRRPRQARRLIATARQSGDPLLVQGTWETQAESHSSFEPHVCIARWHNGQTLSVDLSTQSCAHLAQKIAKRYHLPATAVQVHCDHVGGAFGSKLDLTAEALAAISLSRVAGAPVRVMLDRQEELSVGGVRPAVGLEVALLGGHDGSLRAVSIEAYGETGTGIGSMVANLCQTIYPTAATYLADYDIVTHTPPGKPFRAPGGPPAFWALEQAVDELALRLGRDPIALRRGWNPAPALAALYDEAARQPIWRHRQTPRGQTGRFRRGVGVAAASWMYFLQPNTLLRLIVTPQGLKASTASQDMGNGTRTVIAYAVAEVFGLAPDSIDVALGDSRLVVGPASSGSRTTTSVAPAARDAAQQLRALLVEFARRQFGLPDAQAVSGGVRGGTRFIPWPEVFAAAPALSAVGRRGKDTRPYAMPFPIKDMQIGSGSAWGVVISEVEVDQRFGTVRVLRVWSGVAAGRIVVPPLARSQAYGGIIQGIGYALYEECQRDPATGLVLSANLEDYRLPGIADTPEMEIFFHEGGFEHVCGGSVGLGEITTVAVSAAIGNAVHHATGWRPRSLPLRPDRVLDGLRGV
ncbi:MAG: xanthine dehydrogenase family protein molybdopterin-binding subunit [Roseiflexaceae bacterium]